jgi:transcription-repair coupling factor (superfamily II helicase)
MMRFVAGEANVLVSTTIIESGIDIPNANTILINRADCFGLAQLYQLRGRVGRSSVRASCYLLVPSPHNLDGDAAERIGAIQRFSELGSGYQIASHDLDIRGAGDLLGAEQAGNIDAVGYEAYLELLQQAIVDLRASQAGAPPPAEIDPELRIPIEARIPESWLPETSLRLRLYRALAGARSHAELTNLMADAIDRFGPAPEAMHSLIGVMALKLDAKALGLASVGLGPARLALGVTGAPPLLPPIVFALIQQHAARGWRLTPEGQILLPIALGGAEKAADRLLAVRETLLAIRNFVSNFGRAPSGATGDHHAGPPEPRPSPADRGVLVPRPGGHHGDGLRLERQSRPERDRHRPEPQRRVLDVEPSSRRRGR